MLFHAETAAAFDRPHVPKIDTAKRAQAGLVDGLDAEPSGRIRRFDWDCSLDEGRSDSGRARHVNFW